jgi:hypothetical protein
LKYPIVLIDRENMALISRRLALWALNLSNPIELAKALHLAQIIVDDSQATRWGIAVHKKCCPFCCRTPMENANRFLNTGLMPE